MKHLPLLAIAFLLVGISTALAKPKPEIGRAHV